MTPDEVNSLWQQSQDDAKGMSLGFTTQQHYFAALVAAAEREACAKLCEDAISSIWEFHPEYVNEVGRNVCTNLAAAILARGERDED